jgi:hypothetical protein
VDQMDKMGKTINKNLCKETRKYSVLNLERSGIISKSSGIFWLDIGIAKRLGDVCGSERLGSAARPARSGSTSWPASTSVAAVGTCSVAVLISGSEVVVLMSGLVTVLVTEPLAWLWLLPSRLEDDWVSLAEKWTSHVSIGTQVYQFVDEIHSRVVRASGCQCQFWDRSQHPPTQWNLKGAEEAVLNNVHKIGKI